MSLIPSLTTLRVEDFSSEREWIGKLLFPLNQFLLAATSSINGNITFGDNIPCQTQILSFTYGGVTNYPKTFSWKLATKPVELRVCQATENGVAISLANLAWSYANGTVSISSFIKQSTTGNSALVSGALYNIVLRGNP